MLRRFFRRDIFIEPLLLYFAPLTGAWKGIRKGIRDEYARIDQLIAERRAADALRDRAGATPKKDGSD